MGLLVPPLRDADLGQEPVTLLLELRLVRAAIGQALLERRPGG